MKSHNKQEKNHEHKDRRKREKVRGFLGCLILRGLTVAADIEEECGGFADLRTQFEGLSQ